MTRRLGGIMSLRTCQGLIFGFYHHNSLICIKLWCSLVLNGKTTVQKLCWLQVVQFCKKARHMQVFQQSSGFFLFPLEGPKCK